MPTLGYDRAQLLALRRRLLAVSERLALIRQPDAAAAEAMAVLGATRRSIDEVWVAAIDRVLVAAPLEHGWHLATDPVTPTGADVGEIVDLARRMRAGDLDDLLDDQEGLDHLTRLLGELTRDPVLLRRFRAELGGDDPWVRLADALGVERLETAAALVTDPDDVVAADRLRRLDATVAAVAAVYGAGPHESRRPWYPAALLDMEPYAAALLVRELHLDRDVLAAVCDRILVRWTERERPWADQSWSGPNTADLLFPVLVERPGAATEFVLRAGDHPEVLFRTTQDESRLEALLLAATDPDRIDAGTAGTAIRPLLDWLDRFRWQISPTDDGAAVGAVATMGVVVAPWLLNFGPRADEWGWSAAAADAALRRLIDDEATAARLVDAMHRWRTRLTDLAVVDDDGRVDDELLHDLATMFAQLQLAFFDEEVDDAVTDQMLTDLVLRAAEAAVAAAVPGGPAVSAATDAGLGMLGPAAVGLLQRAGVIPSLEQRTADARVRLGRRASDVAVVAVVAVVERLVETGRLPADVLGQLELPAADGSCTPAQVERALHDWVRGLAAHCDPATHNAITTVLYAFANPLSTRQLCS